ncbi:MAG: MFS transporter [Thermomicrobiales bacterium]|nr:MFS transporter [Thermomicrobiales bacterium]
MVHGAGDAEGPASAQHRAEADRRLRRQARRDHRPTVTGVAARRRIPFLPDGATGDAAVLLRTRAVRAFGDGFVSVILPLHLASLGLSNARIGFVVTATMVGSAALTLFVGLVAYRVGRRALLLRVSLLMLLTGLGFAFVHDFWPLLLVAFLGTLNPSSGDVSVFLPTEQALLPQTVSAASRTTLFARYSLVGSLLAAFGALASGLPELLVDRTSLSLRTSLDLMFVIYGALGLVIFWQYRTLSPAIEPADKGANTPLGPSRPIVYKLAALFSLDSFAGGFVVQSLLALWLFQRFDLSVATTGTIFFWTGLCSAFSQLAAPRLARKIGLVRTMAYTHIPANIFLILTPFMPTLPLAIATLLLRSLVSSMDVPARTSYVMAVVTPAERPAAASVTNVPRSLATAASPSLSGWLLSLTTFGWPLLIGGVLKVAYDLLLLKMFKDVQPPEERG